jgi:hypothetical protein
MAERGDTLCSSVFKVGEVLTGPYRRGAVEVAKEKPGSIFSYQ